MQIVFSLGMFVKKNQPQLFNIQMPEVTVAISMNSNWLEILEEKVF